MRVAVFGGSFDPIHCGHLAVADAAQDALALDLLLWVPARQAPHKLAGAPASGEDRAALIELAIRERPRERLSRVELAREGPSYSVDTLETVAAAHPAATLFLLLGGDAQEHWPSWRRRERILELAELVWVPRRGWERLRPELPGRMLAMAPVDVSATELRARLAAGQDCAGLLPPAVEEEIRRRRLYRRA